MAVKLKKNIFLKNLLMIQKKGEITFKKNTPIKGLPTEVKAVKYGITVFFFKLTVLSM